jgi:hypothetical protein
MTPLGNQKLDLVFGSWGPKLGLQTGLLHDQHLTKDNSFYPTIYQPELPTNTLSYSICVFFDFIKSSWGEASWGP